MRKMSFSEALDSIKRGCKVCRSGWNGKGMYLELNYGKWNMQPFIVIFTVGGTFVPWVASQPDLLSNDWEVVL